jgi:putative PIN family toxin of toxin-antitoxin system
VRLVLDTNVVLSALLWGGTPERLIELAGEGTIELATSEALLAELAGLFSRPKLVAKLARDGQSAEEILARYTELAELIEAPVIEEARLRDPDDAAVLACALASHAEAIVSGDKDLQTLSTYQGIPILSPAQCLQRLVAQPVRQGLNPGG